MGGQEGLYKSKYRINSSRYEGYDYSQPGGYFVTICVKNFSLMFGKVEYDKVVLSELGRVAVKEWLNSAKIRSNIFLDEFIVMPNHIHGIIFIQNAPVETHCNASLQSEYKNYFGPQKNNLSAIIRGFKGAVKRWCNRNNVDFLWQDRFYDRIIRNEKELINIREYIINNPLKWDLDKNNPNNLKNRKV